MAYGVATANKFNLLEDNDTENVEPVKPQPKAAEPKAKETAKPVTKVAAGVEARIRGNANGPTGGRGRGEGRGGRGGRGRGYDRPPGDEGEAGDAADADRRSRPGRGRGGGRGDRGRRRDHDRQDGTGRGHETEKREGAGKGNWGAVAEEGDWGTVAEEEPTEDNYAKVQKGVEETAPAEGATPEVAAEEAGEPAEPEKEEMTLEEYEKVLAEKRAKLNKKPASKEKQADPNAFEGMKVARKSNDEDNKLELSTKKQVSSRKSGAVEKTRKEKELLPTGFRVGSEDSGRPRGRGGRGGERGRRDERPDFREERPPRRDGDANSRGGRGGFRGRGGDRPAGRGRGRDGPAPAINDDSAFPTLGGGK